MQHLRPASFRRHQTWSRSKMPELPHSSRGERPHSRGAICTRVMRLVRVPRKSEGAGNAGCTPHPLPCVRNRKKCTQANTGTPKSLRHSLRNGLRLIARSPRSTGLVSLRPPGLGPGVDPSVGGSGPHAFAVRLSAHHLTRQQRPSHPARRFVTIGRNVPHVRARHIR
jgi:hypothetical protein